MKCAWCEAEGAIMTKAAVYWELPDGTRAIEIRETPTISCAGCGMNYQTDELVTEIEDQLFLIDTKKLPKVLTYDELMALPRLLKRNYFNFS
ncbi:putative YokU family protein [Peribacillus deserti]|uniref:YokU family protein n=1 Tax=Peribacillus deserti TaxID=673318 RepID=A0ABS2QFX2_9BACI|nr:YokU family protein [Peribacillus deserti]MBM7691196.1 putative YokU family protein [Peribacillus deserti]